MSVGKLLCSLVLIASPISANADQGINLEGIQKCDLVIWETLMSSVEGDDVDNIIPSQPVIPAEFEDHIGQPSYRPDGQGGLEVTFPIHGYWGSFKATQLSAHFPVGGDTPSFSITFDATHDKLMHELEKSKVVLDSSGSKILEDDIYTTALRIAEDKADHTQLHCETW